MVVNTGDNRWAVSNFIVAPTIAEGASFTTIAAALTAAASGNTIFIKPGTYTENLTLKAGVNLVAFTADSQTPNVIISGNATASFAGTCTLSGIRLQTNSAALLTVSGSSATIVNLTNCYLNCTNSTGISFTSSDANALINMTTCQGDTGTTGIALFASSSAGMLSFNYCVFTNTGATTTASTISAGRFDGEFSKFTAPITSSGTANASAFKSTFNTGTQNVTPFTSGGSSATNTVKLCFFGSGSASAVSIGSNLAMIGCEVNTSNTNAITGAGTLTYAPVDFSGPGQTINTTTRLPLNFGSWTPTIIGATTAGVTTYTTQFGQYTIVGNLVYVEATIVITGATGTGNATIGGLPFTVKNISNYGPRGVITIASTTWTFPAGTTQVILAPTVNTTNSLITAIGTGAAAIVQMNNSAATFAFSCWYQI